jgi:hypothetical protein
MRKAATVALRGSGSLPASACSAASASGPLILTIAIAAGGAPDDKA